MVFTSLENTYLLGCYKTQASTASKVDLDNGMFPETYTRVKKKKVGDGGDFYFEEQGTSRKYKNGAGRALKSLNAFFADQVTLHVSYPTPPGEYILLTARKNNATKTTFGHNLYLNLRTRSNFNPLR